MNLRIAFLAGTMALLAAAAPPPMLGMQRPSDVALIAEKHLTPEAKQFLQKLLGDNPSIQS